MTVGEVVSAAVQIGLFVLPWPVRRRLLKSLFGFRIHPTARLGFTLIFAKEVTLEAHASISHLTMVSPIQRLHLGKYARVGPRNRITGRQRTSDYAEERERIAALVMEDHSAITRGHLIDCTNTLTVGKYALIAGSLTQILTHSPDFRNARQSSKPSRIGDYCFIGTGAIILAGVELADYCFLGAGSVLTKSWTESYWLLSGTPATAVKRMSPDLRFYSRAVGKLT